MEYKATRMDLMKVKNRIKLAKKGHTLLKKKRDALVMEFFKIIKQARDLREKLNEKLKEAYKSIMLVHFYHSVSDIENIIASMPRNHKISVSVKNIMGIKIPEIKGELDQKSYEQRGYSPLFSDAKIDKAVDDFEEVLKLLLDVAATETAIKRILAEIEKTKRRVNSLEYILLPELEYAKKDITLKLDELERNSFVSLKVIKRKIEEKKEQ